MKLKRFRLFLILFAVLTLLVVAAQAQSNPLEVSPAPNIDQYTQLEPPNYSEHGLIMFGNTDILNNDPTTLAQMQSLGITPERISELQTSISNTFEGESVQRKVFQRLLMMMQISSYRALNCFPGLRGNALMTTGYNANVTSKFTLSTGDPRIVYGYGYCDDVLGCTFFADATPGTWYSYVQSHETLVIGSSLFLHNAWCGS